MSKRSVKKHNRKPDAVKITFKGLVAAGREKAKLAKLTKLIPQLAPTADEVMLEVSELSETSAHNHDEFCGHAMDEHDDGTGSYTPSVGNEDITG